jgi:hypothetical protein
MHPRSISSKLPLRTSQFGTRAHSTRRKPPEPSVNATEGTPGPKILFFGNFCSALERRRARAEICCTHPGTQRTSVSGRGRGASGAAEGPRTSRPVFSPQSAEGNSEPNGSTRIRRAAPRVRRSRGRTRTRPLAPARASPEVRRSRGGRSRGPSPPPRKREDPMSLYCTRVPSWKPCKQAA